MWSLAGPIQRAACIWTSARLPKERRGVYPVSQPGLGIGALVGKVFREIGSVPQTHPEVGMLHRKKVAQALLQSGHLPGWFLPIPQPSWPTGQRTMSPKGVSVKVRAAGLLLRLSSSHPQQRPSPLAKPTVRGSGSRGIGAGKD